jgi:hypothetical protein
MELGTIIMAAADGEAGARSHHEEFGITAHEAQGEIQLRHLVAQKVNPSTV